MIRGVFQHKDNVLVEGMSDYYYLHALAQQCRRSGRKVYPTKSTLPHAAGRKNVGHIASLFLGEEVRPLVLLDGDAAGRARRDALVKELYAEQASALLMLDDALGRSGTETEIEDVVGESLLLPAVAFVVGKSIKLTTPDRGAGSLPSQVEACAKRLGIKLPTGWKASVAIHLVSEWATKGAQLPDEVLDRAAALFAAIAARF